ncbi:MAG TPA: solute carrier family 23 protein [Candidatus Brocadiia bacterium]|nr:solute carrier family 23 protein [Candidatus Brocadiia bacterium]
MPQRPASIVYGLTDRPPIWITVFLAFQHVCIVAISLILPVVVVQEAGSTIANPTLAAAGLVSCSMLAGAVGCVAQVLSRGPVGSGYLCPQLCGPSFLSASIMAAKTGGLSLVLGMNLVAGAIEAVFGSFMRRLRTLFPAEVTGVIVTMVGVTVTRFTVPRFLGVSTPNGAPDGHAVLVSVFTLAVMVGLNVWSRGKLKLFGALIGMTAGYLLAWAFGLLDPEAVRHIRETPLFWFPLAHHPGWTFSAAMIIPCVVATLCSTLKTVGDLTTCQRINDASWTQPDMKNISKGIIADAAGCLAAGLIGGHGQSSSSTNIGLAIATGVTSRIIAWVTAILLAILAFVPKVASVFVAMPAPVMGAVLLFALSFMVVAGLQIITSRMMDTRKTFVVGIPIVFGIGVDIFPHVFENLHPVIYPIFSSSLSASAVLAVVLNLIFRIGIARKATLDARVGQDMADSIFKFMEHQGSLWGARHDVINNVTAAMTEFMEAAPYLCADGGVHFEVSFDEFNIEARIRYKGKPLEISGRMPDKEEMFSDPGAPARLAGYLMRHYADKITTHSAGDEQTLTLRFVH